MVNPFEYMGEYRISISSGCVASKDTRDNIITTYTIGQNGAKSFVEKRMKPTRYLIQSKQINRRPFPLLGKQQLLGLYLRQYQFKASSDMFYRLLIIGKSRDIDLEELLSYALSPVPMSLGTTDGTPCKTVKAKLIHELEKDVEPLAQVPAGLL